MTIKLEQNGYLAIDLAKTHAPALSNAIRLIQLPKKVAKLDNPVNGGRSHQTHLASERASDKRDHLQETAEWGKLPLPTGTEQVGSRCNDGEVAFLLFS
jgi:hypothetical protein